jgi:carboxymethylenebutenolidase
MFNDISKPAPPLPSTELSELMPGVALLRPLSRRGTGPGIIVLTGNYEDPLAIKEGVPSPLVKWAEEGYTVVEIQAQALRTGAGHIVKAALDALSSCDKCEPKDKVGLVGEYIVFPLEFQNADVAHW